MIYNFRIAMAIFQFDFFCIHFADNFCLLRSALNICTVVYILNNELAKSSFAQFADYGRLILLVASAAILYSDPVTSLLLYIMSASLDGKSLHFYTN